MSNLLKEQTWWTKTTPTPAGQGFANRKKAIEKYRSPSTVADEILRVLQWGIQPLLLVFCMALSFSSYEAFFAHNFSPLFSLAGAIILSLVIELGKIKLGGYVVQIPFLSGVKILKSSFPAFCVWAGALLITIATFSMSVKNSTQGAELLALSRGFEKNEKVFTPNTKEVDAQIAQVNGQISNNQTVKWKGVVTYNAQKAIQTASKSVESLQAQRAEQIAIQRADFERSRTNTDANTQTGASWLMASGGYVELLQALALFLIAACMAVIDRNITDAQQTTPTPAPSQSATGPVFTQTRNGANSNQASRPPIGFQWQGYGVPTPGQNKAESVPQSEIPVPQSAQSVGADATLRWLRSETNKKLKNFGQKHRDNGTVARSIHDDLATAWAAMNEQGFSPSREVALNSWLHAVERIFPTLNMRGFPYDFEESFTAKILSAAQQSPEFQEDF